MIADVCLLIGYAIVIVLCVLALGFATGWSLRGTHIKETNQHQLNQIALLENIIKMKQIEY